MRSHTRRILSEKHISPSEWAILSSATLFLPVSIDQLLMEASLDSEEEFSESELLCALDKCIQQGWVDQEEAVSDGFLVNGAALTEAGFDLKCEILMFAEETVELT